MSKHPKMTSKLARESFDTFSNILLKSIVYSKQAFDVVISFVNKFKFNTEFIDDMEKILKLTLKDMLVREKYQKRNKSASPHSNDPEEDTKMTELLENKRIIFIELTKKWLGTGDRRLSTKIKTILSKANSQWKSQNDNESHMVLKQLLIELGVKVDKD